MLMEGVVDRAKIVYSLCSRVCLIRKCGGVCSLRHDNSITHLDWNPSTAGQFGNALETVSIMSLIENNIHQINARQQ